ncbi:MAG: GTP-binding protein [Deltaproteobacteria bacterium]|nr:GTP-binding protein [Deltaproteobacteria bacterium]
MGATTDVFLITGFLGSGKTTFLNRIIKAFPRDRSLMILMNEFGDLGVDGALVEGEDLDMLEISRGSIFCVCVKTDFIRGLADIAKNKRPDVLLIEATGVANPTDVKKDLELSIFKNRFQLKEQFCLIDAANFEDVYDTFTSVEKQLESATLFIINKIDEADAAAVARVREIVRRHHPEPAIIETRYADIPLENYLSTRDLLSGDRLPDISPAELDRFIDGLMAAPGLSMMPADQLVSKTVAWAGGSRQSLAEMVDKMPAGILRAKGIVQAGDGVYLFNCVMGKSRFERVAARTGMAAIMNRLVFIGTPEAMERLEKVEFKDLFQEK